ncbi:MAG: glycoside hydrolase 43 family protein [Lachnospiraceae bacterium]
MAMPFGRKENIMSSEGTWIADLGNGNYRNPILYTDYSDPDVIRNGEDYFMVASSFCNTPAVPLLHSKDLVNWKVINYVVEKLPGERFEKPAHGCGAWAPSIRFHDGYYWVFVPMPDEGIFMCKAKDPWGTWSEPVFVYSGKGWIDPCPLWDDDGKAYMVNAFARSRIGFKSILHVSPMKTDATGLLDEGQHVFDGNVNDQVTIEGPKFYKRNGYYYIFAPAGGVKTGWQTVLRSKNVYGPYEYRNVMIQGDTKINGPHQGGWVDTPSGEDWFIHFQDVYAAGRIIHLQPMRWVDDWPVIGEYVEGREYGTPVLEYKKPDVGGTYPMEAPDAGDEFDSPTLGLQWQWNANYKDSWYAMDPEGSSIVLNAVKKEDATISNAPNLLLQKWCMPEFEAKTVVETAGLKVGDMAGMVSLGMNYGALAVKKEEDGLHLVKISGHQVFTGEVASAEDEIADVAKLPETERVYFNNRVYRVEEVEPGVPHEMITLGYGLKEDEYEEVLKFEALAGRWVGVKNGIFALSEREDGGKAAFDYFRIQ